MSNENKVTLTLSAAALAVLEKRASPRKRGEFVSKLLLEYSAVDSGIEAVDIEAIKLQIIGLAAGHKLLEAQLFKLERQLAQRKE